MATRSQIKTDVDRHRKALVHFIANCTVCDWRTQDYQTGQKKAAAHARSTGHRVIADLGYVIEYGPNVGAKAPT